MGFIVLERRIGLEPPVLRLQLLDLDVSLFDLLVGGGEITLLAGDLGALCDVHSR